MQQRDGPPDRTEIERHWDEVCLGLTAAGTAVMAAVFLISGVAEERTEPLRVITAVKYAGGAMLAGSFAFMVVRMHRTISPKEVPEEEKHIRKENDAKGVTDMLGTIVLGLAAWVVILAFIPLDKPLSDDMSKSIRINEATWEHLENLVGPEGTADEKVGRLLETAGESRKTEGKKHRKGLQRERESKE